MSIVVLCTMVCMDDIWAQDSNTPKASYYSDYLHGWTMANGEPYHKDSMTCAHLYYPLGTTLKVRNLRNGKEVIVTVTDRGPYAEKYSLDLSKAAAIELDFIFNGFCPVEICPIHPDLIPFRKEEKKDIPIYELVYSPVSSHSIPVWQQGSETQKLLLYSFKRKETKK